MSDDDFDTFEKKTINTAIGLDLDQQLTWGELIWFVDQGRKTGVRPDSPVGMRFAPHDGHLESLFVYIDPSDID
ncbi:hypothetical protein [Nocardioides bruguierae]|uniref:hypothetical protein n=1 Tax=Nocardioides bruguierae TaxID=2945102 RepID=UPI0020202D18|nr:hypothetical protein [Nocardioides bruguierae]MCL8027342.1 hypothetical protein [Nocardioides bruguierae]